MRARSAVTVNRPPDEVHAFFADVENLPAFMAHLESVRATGEGRTRWVARAPAGRTLEWEAEVVDHDPPRAIAWRSLEGTAAPNAGRVRFTPAPAGQGTEVSCELEYSPPGGALGALVARLFGEEPSQQLADDLRRLKQVLETGEVVVSDSMPGGTRTLAHLSRRRARPPGGAPG
ncbi:MAG: SRPBCC family protein [Acidimicrobiales bacterium]